MDMRIMKWCLGMLVACGVLFGAVRVRAEASVTDVTAKQRYPWNGLVDIRCTVAGVEAGVSWLLVLEAVDPGAGDVRELSHCWIVRDGTNSTDRVVHADGEYELLWDARADLGEVVCSNMAVQVSCDPRPLIQLWEGGPYWADRNIGAEEPWEYGYYFWWGDTVGYVREDDQWVASDGSATNFSFANAPHYGKNRAWLLKNGWITEDNTLVPEHDAARVQWGGGWRMPTKQELQDLVDKCDRTWITTNGVKGHLVRGRGDYASATIFLPAAGFGDKTDLKNETKYGYLWSSEPNIDPNPDGKDNSYLSWRLNFRQASFYMDYHYDRHSGTSFRPVRGGAE